MSAHGSGNAFLYLYCQRPPHRPGPLLRAGHTAVAVFALVVLVLLATAVL